MSSSSSVFDGWYVGATTSTRLRGSFFSLSGIPLLPSRLGAEVNSWALLVAMRLGSCHEIPRISRQPTQALRSSSNSRPVAFLDCSERAENVETNASLEDELARRALSAKTAHTVSIVKVYI